MKKLILLTLVICTATISPGQSLISKIKKSGELRVGMTGSQPPFNIKAKNGEIIGYEVELATMLAEGMGVELKIMEIPFSNLMTSLSKGQVDVVLSNMSITTERNMNVAFKGPYMISGKSILTKTPTLKTVTSPGEINNDFTTIAVLKGSTSETYAKNQTPFSKLVAVNNYDEGIAKIRSGEVDLLLADFAICAYSALTIKDEQFYTLAQPLSIEPVGLAMPATDPLFLNLVDNFFVNATLDGTLDALQDKWFNDGSWVEKVK